MQYYKCKCGETEFFGSYPPSPCTRCKVCGTNMNGKIPEEHKFELRYNEKTGKPSHEICTVCYERKKLS